MENHAVVENNEEENKSVTISRLSGNIEKISDKNSVIIIGKNTPLGKEIAVRSSQVTDKSSKLKHVNMSMHAPGKDRQLQNNVPSQKSNKIQGDENGEKLYGSQGQSGMEMMKTMDQ
jgi:hypothetical protein